MPVSVADFTKSAVQHGLIPPDAVNELLTQSNAAAAHDVTKLADLMVSRRWLTRYQAAKLLDNRASELFLGEYVLLEKLGTGGMGLVYKAFHRRQKGTVSVKFVPPQPNTTASAILKFFRQIEPVARLKHPNLITGYNADSAAGLHFLVTDFVEGNDLAHVVHENGPLPVRLAVEFLLQAARGLSAAHRAGFLHLDLKPANLLVDNQRTLRVLDLGLAAIHDFLASGDDRTLAIGGRKVNEALLSTIDYMAPEQTLSPRFAEARSDIYSLATLFYFMVNGRPPYGGDTLVERLVAHREKPVPHLAKLRPGIPNDLDLLLCRMLAKRPEDRPASMDLVVNELESNKANFPPDLDTVSAWKGDSTLGLVMLPAIDDPLDETSSPSSGFTNPGRPIRPAGGWASNPLPWFLGGGVVGGAILVAAFVITGALDKSENERVASLKARLLELEARENRKPPRENGAPAITPVPPPVNNSDSSSNGGTRQNRPFNNRPSTNRPNNNRNREPQDPAKMQGPLCGAIVVRQAATGWEMLVFSDSSGLATVPFGVKDPQLTEAETAEEEAYQKAGINGQCLSDEPAGVVEIANAVGVRTIKLFLVTGEPVSGGLLGPGRWKSISDAATELGQLNDTWQPLLRAVENRLNSMPTSGK